MAKYDLSGTHKWSKRFGAGFAEQFPSIAVDAAGAIYMTGGYFGNIDFGTGRVSNRGSHDMFLTKFDSQGTCLWSKGFGGTSDDRGWAIEIDSTDNVYVTGKFNRTANFGGADLTTAGQADVFVASYDTDGVHQWSRRLGGSHADFASAIAVDSTGRVLVTGTFEQTGDFGNATLTSQGLTDVFLVAYDANGTAQWSQRFGGSGSETSMAVALDAAGNAHLTGFFTNTASYATTSLTSAGGADIYLLSVDGAGVLERAQRFGASGSDVGSAVTVDDRRVCLGGWFGGAPSFGSWNASTSGSAGFVASITQ